MFILIFSCVCVCVCVYARRGARTFRACAIFMGRALFLCTWKCNKSGCLFWNDALFGKLEVGSLCMCNFFVFCFFL